MTEKMSKTEISSTGTRHDVPSPTVGVQITYLTSWDNGSSYRLPMNDPSTKDERQSLRRQRDS